MLPKHSMQTPLRGMRTRAKESGLERGAVAKIVVLLLAVATLAFVGGSTMMIRAQKPEHARLRDATILLAKSAGLNNPDEAKMLLEALQDGTLDYEAVYSALEEGTPKKDAKSKTVDKMDATTTEPSERHVSSPTAVKRASQSLSDDDDLNDEDHIHWHSDPFVDDLGDDLGKHLHEREELKRDTRRNSGKRNEPGGSRRVFRQSLIPKSSRNRMDRQSPPLFLDDAANKYAELDLWEDED